MFQRSIIEMLLLSPEKVDPWITNGNTLRLGHPTFQYNTDALINFINDRPAITSLDCSGKQPLTYQFLYSLFIHCQHISSIDLSSTVGIPAGKLADLVSIALWKAPKLTKIILSNNGLDDDFAVTLSRSLRRNKTLREIELTNNNFSTCAIELLSLTFESTPTLELMSLTKAFHISDDSSTQTVPFTLRRDCSKKPMNIAEKQSMMTTLKMFGATNSLRTDEEVYKRARKGL